MSIRREPPRRPETDGRGRGGVRVRPGGRRRPRRRSRRGAESSSSSCSCRTRTGAIRGVANPRSRRDAAEGRRDGQRRRRAARLHRLHRRPDPHHRRRRRAPQAHDASSSDIVGRPQGQGRALHAGRARRLARQRRGLQGVLRRHALHLRPQGRALHRPRQRLRPRGARRRRAARLAGADLEAAGRRRRIVVLTHRPLFDLHPQWDWATRDGAKVDRRCCCPTATSRSSTATSTRSTTT